MSYEKTTWVNGDVITAEKLNHIEEGIKNAGDLIEVHIIGENYALDMTYAEILNAIQAGKMLYILVNDFGFENAVAHLSCAYYSSEYTVSFCYISGNIEMFDFITNSEDGYPVYDPELRNS